MAFGIYVIFFIGVYCFLKNNKIILDEPKENQKISLNHIEIKPIEKEFVEDKIVNNNIQEEIKEEIKEQKIEEKQEEIIEEKVVEVPKPVIKKEIKEKVLKKVQKKEVIEKKQIVKKEIKETKNIEKEAVVKEQIVQNDIQIEKTPQKQTKAIEKIDDRKAYLDKHLSQIRNLINKNVHYPKRARKLSIEGIVVVKFKINENGSIENIAILEGHKFLQNATIEAIQEASKSFPKTNKSIEIQIPIEYKLI
jgi:periplasmic protein TonB